MSEVEELRAEAERLRIRNKSLWADLGQANQWSWEQHDRAESAERARDAALAEATGLRDRLGQVDESNARYFQSGWEAAVREAFLRFDAGQAEDFRHEQRAALAVPVTGDTEDAWRETETALREEGRRAEGQTLGGVAQSVPHPTQPTVSASPTEQATEGGA